MAFQSFDTVSDPSAGPARLARLRVELARRGLDGFLVPLADEHQGEYIPDCAKRLAWLTGFAGSAGLCIVLADRAAIFVDGRYTLQVKEQVDVSVFEPRHLVDDPPHTWLKTVAAGRRIGFDPWLHTASEVERFRKALAAVGGDLVAVPDNLLDTIWSERPAPPVGPVSLYPVRYAGEAADEKIRRIAADIREAGADAAVLTQPDSIAWLLNIRGDDVPHNPVPLAFAILRADGRPTLFVDGRKLSNSVRDDLSAHVEIAEPGALPGALKSLGTDGARVLVDKATAAFRVVDLVTGSGGTIVDGRDPVVLPKARKNAAELAATRVAHLRDAVAVCRFLAWFDREAPKGQLTEITAAEALERFRAGTGSLKEIAFDTISGAGLNAAIPHYRVSKDSNRPIRRDEIYLIDSGGQYEDGTTDITRTLIVGEPTAEMRDRNTRVLIGHIRIAIARFPKGTTGAHLDILARQALWNAGLDFDHGTGHGVGVYLSVHEGPQRISKLSHVALEPGMILSNEPGFYKAGAFGIRIENLIIVSEPAGIEGGERPMMGFETITFAPIDRRLIEPALLSPEERAWLNRYHAEVRDKVGPLLDPPDRDWLDEATAPI